ncbi:hypothetical protein Scep_015107 [Stephania cephalantha]|uniref:IspG TIM-barrel domain-containing protein n=1 Tax=Stephania cephalantha TaxID=152367 RepID=A0AAP0J2F7_9MAGN
MMVLHSSLSFETLANAVDQEGKVRSLVFGGGSDDSVSLLVRLKRVSGKPRRRSCALVLWHGKRRERAGRLRVQDGVDRRLCGGVVVVRSSLKTTRSGRESSDLELQFYNIPLVADIHFAPAVALRVAECFDKIRVNPGNFRNSDRRAQFETIEYTDEEYQEELERIEKMLKKLSKQLNGEDWSWNNLNTLCWAIGVAGPSGFGSSSIAEQVTENRSCSLPSQLTAIVTGLVMYSRAMISMHFFGYLGELELARWVCLNWLLMWPSIWSKAMEATWHNFAKDNASLALNLSPIPFMWLNMNTILLKCDQEV